MPKFSTTELAERWSDLMPLLSWQLWLAREIVEDNPLPWQKPRGLILWEFESEKFMLLLYRFVSQSMQLSFRDAISDTA